MTFTEPIEIIISITQKRIWDAQYFIRIDVNIEYWAGQKDALEGILSGFRDVGISVSSVVDLMEKPNYLIPITYDARTF